MPSEYLWTSCGNVSLFTGLRCGIVDDGAGLDKSETELFVFRSRDLQASGAFGLCSAET